jgi:shikimate kinase
MRRNAGRGETKGRVRAGASAERPASERAASDAARVVVITGFMCAGKSTVARELGRRLSCRVIDLDDLVTGRAGRTPRELIEEDGEARFRELETEALRAALEGDGPAIVALGGGAWTLERNRALVGARAPLTVWLDAPFELCWQRIGEAAATRPLARDEQQARRLYDERRESYRLAELHIRAEEGRSPDDLAAEIARVL